MLSRHAPQRMKSVLDPAVGQGALLLPMAARLERGASVVCVDIDSAVLNVARTRITSTGFTLNCVNGDFLQQVSLSEHLRPNSFDCVVMNPPYAAKKTEWMQVDCAAIGWPKVICVPKEIAFVLRGIELLRKGGRLLAILPASLISASLLKDFRIRLGSIGQFHYVHELPKFTFQGVEGRVYLVVFEKGDFTTHVELRNHDLRSPDRMKIAWSELGEMKRLDYGFQESCRWFDALVNSTSKLVWQSVDALFSMRRGPRKSPRGPRIAMHTTDCQGGFWNSSNRHLAAGKKDRLGEKDFLIARVGRNCVRSIGTITNYQPSSWSDCVLRLRLRNETDDIATLLSLRVILNMPGITKMIERGVGATYITESDLGSLRIPTKLAILRSNSVLAYADAVFRRDRRRMKHIETMTMQWLLRQVASKT